MGILDDCNLSSSDEDDDYNPYDETGKYGQYGKCMRGINISKNGWCCKSCERDRCNLRRAEKQARNNIFFEFREKYTYYEPASSPIFQITNDWKILGLIPPKTKQELKKKYRELVLKHHPDKGGDSEQFVKITDSYNTLCLAC